MHSMEEASSINGRLLDDGDHDYTILAKAKISEILNKYKYVQNIMDAIIHHKP